MTHRDCIVNETEDSLVAWSGETTDPTM